MTSSLPGIEGKAIIVTGAARGLGLEYARHLVATGAFVVMNDFDHESLDEAAEGLHNAVAVAGSVADPATADSLVAASLAAFGRLDGLVNNAGIRPEGYSWNEDPAVTRQAVEVNVLGSIYCGAAVLRILTRQGTGAVVNVSSRAQTGIEQSATYSATKGAIASLTYSWALDAPPGVRVNAIAPHARGTGTRRADSVPRPEEPEAGAIAPLVTYLLSDAASAIRGQVVRIVGTRDGLALGIALHPRDGHLIVAEGEWSADRIAAAFDAELGRYLEPVGATQRRVDFVTIGTERFLVR